MRKRRTRLFWFNKRHQESSHRLSPEKHFLPLIKGSLPALQGWEIPLVYIKKEKNLFLYNKRIQGFSLRLAPEKQFPALQWDPLPRWESGKYLLLLYKEVENICRNFLSLTGDPSPIREGRKCTCNTEWWGDGMMEYCRNCLTSIVLQKPSTPALHYSILLKRDILNWYLSIGNRIEWYG